MTALQVCEELYPALTKAKEQKYICCYAAVYLLEGTTLPADVAALLFMAPWEVQLSPPPPPTLSLEHLHLNSLLYFHAYPTNRLKWFQPTLLYCLFSFWDRSVASVGLLRACPRSADEVIPFRALTHRQGRRCNQTELLMFLQAVVSLLQ